jgi:hypothetical protein
MKVVYPETKAVDVAHVHIGGRARQQAKAMCLETQPVHDGMKTLGKISLAAGSRCVEA